MSKALLLDVLQSPQDFGLKEEDIIGRRLDYTPPSGRQVAFPPHMTGTRTDQKFTVEEDMPFYVFLFKGKAIGVSERKTSNSLTLKGMIGYAKGKKCIKEINGLYASEELGTKATGLKRKMWLAMPESLKKMCYDYWLSSRFVYPYASADCHFGLQIVYSSGVDNNYLYYYISGSASSGSYSHAVRPTFRLNSGIYIDTDQLCDMDEPIKLILPERPLQEIMSPQIELPNQGGTIEQLLAENQQLKAEIARMKKELDKEQDVINAVRQILRRY